jgi:hypothetical protein
VNHVTLFHNCVMLLSLNERNFVLRKFFRNNPARSRNNLILNNMKKTKKIITQFSMLTAVIVLLAVSGCKKDEPAAPPARETTYSLKTADVLGVVGTATIIETSTTSVTINVVLTNASAENHPAEIRMNSVVEGGAIVIALNPVDETGKSSTLTTNMTYNQLIDYDGFIEVHKNATEQNIILAQGDIGGNVLTASNITYTLDTIGVFGVSGTALFEKRVNGNTLVTISLTGAIAGDSYPATINLGSIETIGGGPVVMLLNDVDGTNGKGYTNVRKLDSGLDITYDNWLVYDGYINIYQNSVNSNNIICHGNIGSN